MLVIRTNKEKKTHIMDGGRKRGRRASDSDALLQEAASAKRAKSDRLSVSAAKRYRWGRGRLTNGDHLVIFLRCMLLLSDT